MLSATRKAALARRAVSVSLYSSRSRSECLPLMSKPAGKCAFCGEPGALSKGHVWPDWLNRILPRTATHHEEETGRFDTFVPQVKAPAYSRRIRQGHARSRKPRNTCKTCNSGWMSSIETLAIPYAEPLLRGNPALLDTFGQRALAGLLCLIAMRLEFLGRIITVTPSDHDGLRHRLWPTNDWKIWVARYGGEKPDENWSKACAIQVSSTPTDKVGLEYCNAKVTTLVIGQLCAHLFYSPVIDFGGYEGITLAQIWPPRCFDIDTGWLPSISDKDLLWLHEAFARESPPMPKT